MIMDDIVKTIRYNTLLAIYSELLSARQKEILCDYYEYNLSISEIAENKNVSRAAVEDAIKKGTSKLEYFEEKLGVYAMKHDINEIIIKFKENNENTNVDDLLEQIKKVIEYGI